jgi:lauroyl/myristoyl acyltransferase
VKRERRHALEAALASAAGVVVRRLPRRLVLALGRALGRLWAALDARQVKIASDNLRQAFPDWDEVRVRATARGVYEHFAAVLLEILWMEGRPTQELLAAW